MHSKILIHALAHGKLNASDFKNLLRNISSYIILIPNRDTPISSIKQTSILCQISESNDIQK